MKSLHTRLDPIRDEVLEFTRTYGRFKAMWKFRVSSYERFCNWLEEVTKDENFGLRPVIDHGSNETLGDQLVSAFLRKVADLEDKLAERDRRIEFLEWQLSHAKDREEQQGLAVLESCQL